jgi:hypothetical protein
VHFFTGAFGSVLGHMKKVTWKNRMKASIETGHKEFDRQCVSVTTGNVIGGGQQSSYIRAFNTRKNPIGQPVAPGEMQAFDLRQFDNLPPAVVKAVKEAVKAELKKRAK